MRADHSYVRLYKSYKAQVRGFQGERVETRAWRLAMGGIISWEGGGCVKFECCVLCEWSYLLRKSRMDPCVQEGLLHCGQDSISVDDEESPACVCPSVVTPIRGCCIVWGG